MAQEQIKMRSLGLDLASGDEKEVFKWFLACFLCAKPIQQQIAVRTWEVFLDQGYDTPEAFLNASWQQLVNLLGEGGYRRYDESTATNLHETMRVLVDTYNGKITDMHGQSRDRNDFTARLQELKGVGPKTVEIFMREVDPVWF
jgi:endonuclease III